MSDFDAGTTAQEEASPSSPTVDEPTEQSAPASAATPEQDLVNKLNLSPTQNVLDTIRGWIAHHFG